MATRHNILVLDSPEPRVRAAEGMARDLGHVVFTHASPVGVGSAVSRHEIDTVLLGWELSKQQDAKLSSLVDSWERLRPLKVVVLVDKRRPELVRQLSSHADVWILQFDELESRLSEALGQTSRELRAASSAPPVGHFVERLRSRLEDAFNVWERIAQGSARYGDIRFPLAAAQGQAELLAFRKLSELLDEVAEVVRAGKAAGSRPTPGQYDAVTAALRFAIHATMAPPYDADRDISPLIRRLKRSRS